MAEIGMRRRFCSKLYLKAETQQVDRILEEFSRRFWDCNPARQYGSASAFMLSSFQYLMAHTVVWYRRRPRGHLLPTTVEHRSSCGRYYQSHVADSVRPEYHDRHPDAAASHSMPFDDGIRPR